MGGNGINAPPTVFRHHGRSASFAGSRSACRLAACWCFQTLGSTVIDPALLTCAERIQYEGFLRRQEDSKGIKALAAAGKSMREITRLTRRSRKLVRSVLRGGDGDVFRCRQSMLEPYIGTLRAEWEADCRNGAELWRRLRAAGFRGGLAGRDGVDDPTASQREGRCAVGQKGAACSIVEPPHDSATEAVGKDRCGHGGSDRGGRAGARHRA